MSLLVYTLLITIYAWCAHAIGRLQVETTSGPVQGFVDETSPKVAQFLGVPYAEPPVGARRWLPSIRKTKSNTTFVADHFGPACPQYEGSVEIQPNVGTVDVRQFTITPFDNQGEDCLSLSIWTPYPGVNRPSSAVLLPVIVWIYGGGFGQGGSNVPYQNPTPWVERSQQHIVVSINHRLELLGFPNSPGLDQSELNLGLLDQRLGVEWIRDNIARFGGDPTRITLMGQSSGALSADYYNYAYPEDPIASGMILHSGTAHTPFGNVDTAQRNFSFIAEQFHCGNTDKTAEVNCLRDVPASHLIGLLKNLSDASALGQITFPAFIPVIDNRTVFADTKYTTRTLAGNFSRIPAIVGTTTNEGVGFVVPYHPDGPNPADADAIANLLFLCPVAQTSRERFAANATTFRYLYDGNFTNVSPRPWLGAYHSSDLPNVFGTYDIVRGEGTTFQREVSEKMQDLWLAFAKNPGSLPELGWEKYEGGEGSVLVFARDGEVTQTVKESEVDAACAASVVKKR